jgi:DNA-binding NarL/FixJ family response regulator
MIVAAVDDLLFSSKIRNVCKRLALPVVFARTPDALLDATREGTVRLAIFDLDSERLQPLDAIASLKADPSRGGIRTIGFASHVNTDVLAAAKAAGADEVLSRGAFTANLPDLLAGTR